MEGRSTVGRRTIVTSSAPSIEAVFGQALEKGSPEERALFLQGACEGREDLRRQVEALLGAYERAGGFLERPMTSPADESTWVYATADGPKVGEIIANRYKLLELIGEGGMGAVWAAEQSQPVRRKVALKLIKAGMDSKAVLARFEAERQALALMDHPNIAKVLDGGLTDRGRPYFVMEYVKGVPITDYCDAARLSVSDRLTLFIQVCNAVQHAHQKGIIHRDLKPSNILVAPYDDKPVPKIIDFGLAKAMHQSLTEKTLHTAHESVLGTPLYMSPEQAQLNNLDVDTRSDVYSLGVLLYELLTGTTPVERQRFKQAAWDEVRRIIREEEPPRPSHRLSTTDTLPSVAAGRQTEPVRLTKLVRGELDWIVMKALEKDRTRRYETANGFAKDVERYLAGEPVQAVPPSAGYQLKKFVRRNRAAISMTTLVAVSAAVVLINHSLGLWEVRRERDRAVAAEQAAVLAREAEAERAEGESKAKQDALSFAAAKREALEQAQKRLGQIEKGNEILTSIFSDLDVRKIKEGTEPLEAVLAKRLVKAAEQLEGETVGDPVAVAHLQKRLGHTLLGLGCPQDAIQLLVKARATLTANLGADHAETLMCMNYLARSYLDAGKFDQALPLGQETLKLRRAKLGADHPDTLTSMGHLAWGYRLVGKPDLALALSQEAFQIRKAKQGADHPATLRCMGVLGLGYHDAGKTDLALPILEEAFRLSKAKFGADHFDTLSSMNNLGFCYDVVGKQDQAIALLEETLRLSKSRLGVDHPDTLTTMNNLAKVYHTAGKQQMSLSLWEDSLKLIRAKLKDEHPLTLLGMANLAKGYHDSGKLDLALPLFDQAATGLEALRFQHEHTARIMVNAIRAYEKAGQPDKASGWQRKWLAAAKNDGAAYEAALIALGSNRLQQKKWSEAEPVLRGALAFVETKQPDAWSTFHMQSMLGGALLGQRKHAEAEPLLLSGFTGMRERQAKIPVNDKPRLSEAVDRLIELYTATNKPDEVKKWKAERARHPATQPFKK
jgi:eukaryotic-like serine/threonine-protein kinase